MYLTKMVNEFIGTVNNTNHHPTTEKILQNPQKSGVSNYKTNKKPTKAKKSHPKSHYNVEETDQLPESSTKRVTNTNDHSKTISTAVTHTKVKSGSWKRSEKSIAPFNALANKKHKSLRKISPNWLKFSNSKLKKQDSSQLVNVNEPTSVCRPGTLYSDVLFSAGCSNLVKIKNITPRNYNNTSANAQKKLTKALFKFNGNHQDIETSDDSEIEEKKNLFPALQKIKNKIYSPSITNYNNNNLKKNASSVEKMSNNELLNTSANSSIPNEMSSSSDVVILSDFKGLSLVDNNISYSNYLEQHFQHLNGKVEGEAAPSDDNKFLFSSISNIPKWNFMNVETGSSDAFPKFLCQFDDESYLKAEKIALLGLKLALGNYSPQNK